MNDFGVALVAGAARCLVLGFFGVVLCIACRRQGPATVAMVAHASLTALVVVAAMASLSWPRWWTFPVPGEHRKEISLSASSNEPSREARATAAASTPAEIDSDIDPAQAVTSRTEAFWATMFLEDLVATPHAVQASGKSQEWRWPGWIAAAYLAGVAVMLTRLLLGLGSLGRLRRRSQPVNDAELLELIETLQAGLGIAPRVRACESAELGTPATVGWRRPVLLLPEDWRGWSVAERRAVVAHELAHVRRGDYAAAVWSRLCVALQFYQPLAHWLAGRLRLQQELAADAWAARYAGGNQAYLQSLAGLALRGDQRSAAWPAQAFFPVRGTLVRRIEMLRDTKSIRDLSARRRSLALAVGALTIAGLFLTGLRGPMPASSASAQTESRPSDRSAGEPTADRRIDPAPTRLDIGKPTPALVADEAYDLSPVPPDVGMILAARPAELVALPRLKSLSGLLGPESALTKQFGIPPDKVEQVTLVWLRHAPLGESPQGPILPPPTAVIIRGTGEAEVDALAAAIVARPKEAHFAGQKYVRSADAEKGPAYSRIDGRTIVVSPQAAELKRYFASRLARAGKYAWGDAWGSIRKGQAAVAIDTAFLVRLLGPSLAGPFAAKLEPFAPLWERTHALAVGFEASNGLVIDFASALNTTDEAGGNKVRKTIEALMTLAGNALPGLREGGTDGPQEAIVILLGVADDLLRSVMVELDSKIVRLRASADLDVAAVFKDAVLPAWLALRSAERRARSADHLKTIGIAVQDYEQEHGHLPPAVGIGPDGKTPHSWRVALLPYLGLEELHSQYHLDEPWDSPSNRKVLESRPEVFGYPGSAASEATHAAYFAIVGPNTVFPPDGQGTKLAKIVDGPANTIMVVEAKRTIPWTKPEDIRFDPSKPTPRFGGFQGKSRSFNACLADGSVRSFKDGFDSNLLKKLLTGNGGEPIGSY